MQYNYDFQSEPQAEHAAACGHEMHAACAAASHRSTKRRKLPLCTLLTLLSILVVFSGCGKQTASQSSAESAASAASSGSAVTAAAAPAADSDEEEDSVFKASIGTSVVGDAAAPLAVYDELLYDYGYGFSGATVASEITVAEIDNNIVYADTEGNDSGWHSLAFEFADASAISSLKQGDSAVITGTVEEPALAGDIITLYDCSVYATGTDAEALSAVYQDCCDSQIQYAEAVINTSESAAIDEASQASYMSSCSPVDYTALDSGAVDTEAPVYLTAQIMQITDSWQDVIVIRAGDPEQSDAVWYITCHAPAQELNAGDTITFYGNLGGIESFSDYEGNITDAYIMKASVLSADAVSPAAAPAASGTEAASDTTAETDTVLFTDVGADSPYYEAISWAKRSGIVSGSDNDTFEPDETCTREQIAAFLWRLAGEPTVVDTESPFSDVTDPTGPFYYAILWNYENGIISGSDEGIFSGEDEITRAQAIMMIWNMADAPEPESSSSVFSDVDPSEYYASAAQWAYEYGVISADDGTFQPDTPCTRAEVIQYLYLFANAV